LFKIIGGYDPESYNILNPYFLPFHFLNKYIKEFSVQSDGILLDIGCGVKPYYKIFNNRIGRYIGLDYKESINTEDLKTVISSERKTDIWGDAIFLPIKSSSVDTVFSSMVLEYINEPDIFIKEISRVLKPKGKLILSSPQSYPIHHKERDFFRFTKHGIKYLLKKNNLEIISIKQNGRFFVHIGEMINHYINRRMFRNVNGLFLKALLGILKIILTPILILITFFINIVCIFLNYFDIDETFTSGYTVLAEKVSNE